MSEEKSKGGRPTTDQVAERSWKGVSNTMKVRVPKLVELSLKRMEEILNDDKAADNSVLRAAAQTIDLYHKLKAAEAEDLAAELKEEAEAQGVLAAVTAEKGHSPLISLVPPPAKVG